MNPTNGKGSGRLHARQQCTSKEMAKSWEDNVKPPSTKCGCNGTPAKGQKCKFLSYSGGYCFAPNAFECEHKSTN